MNGLHIQQVFISGALIGFLLEEEQQYKTIMICLLFVGIKITWW